MKYTLIKSLKYTVVLWIAIVLASCKMGPDYINTQNPGETQETTSTETYIENVSSRNIATEDTSTINFINKLNINLDILSEISKDITDSEGKQISVSYNSSNGEIVVSSKSSETLQVILTGSADNVHLYIENKKDVGIGILLKDVSITSTGNYPAISFDKKAKVYLQLEGNNTITDGRNYGYGYGEEYSSVSTDTFIDDDGNTVNCTVSKNPVNEGMDTKATIYSKGPLILSGTGSLTLTDNYKHGIYSKDYIRLFSGDWKINSSGRNGIQCVNGFIMEDGSVTIKGTGTNTNNQSRGIIVEGEEDENNCGEGYILINGGSIDIETVSKGISAKWDISEDAETTDTADDPYPFVKITGGNISIRTTGTPADESRTAYSFIDVDGVTVNEKTKLSPEGIEGKVAVFIEGGKLNLQTTDDCINASRSGFASLKISGGEVYAYSSGNDAIDSNGTLQISDGTITALTATNPECAFDCDNYSFSITGGTLIGIGTSNYSKPTADVTTQSTIVLSGDYLGTAGKTCVIGETSTSPVFAYTIDSSIFSNMNSNLIAIISSPKIKQDTEYSIFTDSTVSGGTGFHGLYTYLPSASGGTSKASGIKTSSSSSVYTLSNSINGGAQEGGHGNPQDGTQQGPGFGRFSE